MSNKKQLSTKYLNGKLYAPDMLTDMQEAMKAWGISAQKKFGQNFLVDSEVYGRIIDKADLHKIDNVLEIGPGLGFLTKKISQNGAKTHAVEYDNSLHNVLESLSAMYSNISIHMMDALNVSIKDLQDWFAGKYKIVSNLPYAITGAFFRKYITELIRPQTMTVLVQKEVAERICAKPGDMNLLAISVQTYGVPEYVETVPKEVFYPMPRVDSAVVHIDFSIPTVDFKDEADEKKYWQLLKIGFSNPRKTLLNNLSAGFRVEKKEVEKWLEKSGLDLKVRAEDLSLENWVKLVYFRD